MTDILNHQTRCQQMGKAPATGLSHCALAALVVLFALPLPAATVTLNPAADALVTTGPSGTLSGNNYGGAGALAVAAAGLTQGEFQSVLKFDLAAARTSFDSQFGAGQWTIQAVTLALTATAGSTFFNSSAAGRFGISWMQSDFWTEGTGKPNVPTTNGITFASLPSFASGSDESLGTFSFAGGTSGLATYTLGLTPGLVADVSMGNPVSFRLVAADSAVSYLCYSANNPTTSVRPLLSIVAVPEPHACSLLMAAAMFLCSMRFRHRKQPG
ncbi:MAG: hypothetical protein NTW21_03750 [Verrucomicrobia bacterium]|nr:hypothetical protein [Verrucomicrobiota bacterium]